MSSVQTDSSAPMQDMDDDRHRTTIYLTGEEIAILDETRRQMGRTERRRVDRSELIRRAIHMSYGKEDSR